MFPKVIRVFSALAVFFVPSIALAQTCAVALDANHVQFEGTVYRTIDDEGVYYVDESSHGGVPFPVTHGSLADRIGERACVEPARLALVDYVDCTQTDHQFVQSSSGQSRLLNLNGTVFRVTGSPVGFDLFYFAYTVATDPWPGKGHLLVVETINDQERYTGVAITHPRVGAWASPYDGEGVCPIPGREWWDCFDHCEEGDCFHPDVGVSVYTGQEYALDGERFNIYELFYPKMNQVKVTISSSGWYKNRNANSGGAASRIWVYELLDPVASRTAPIEPPAAGTERNIGIYMTHPWYFYGHYGVPSRTQVQRETSLGIMLDTLAFCGFNWVEFNAINGSDRSGFTWYPGSYFPQLGGDLLTELPPIADAKGFGVVPVVTSLLIPGSQSGMPPAPPGWTFTDDSFQRMSNGNFTQAFNARCPDPLRPEVQDWLVYFVEEIAQQVSDEPSVKGIGFRANGKIGLCYQSHQDGWTGAKQSGYSTWDIWEFKNATGSGVPTNPSDAYNWLRARPAEWESWLNFRCTRIRDFWLRVRDTVRSYRPDWNLYVKIVLPSETPGTNIEWPSEGLSAEELLRHHGYDPALYTSETGIVIERTMMVDENRFYTSVRWGSPWGSNDYAYKAFHFQPYLPQNIVTAEGAAVEFYHNYWEEAFHPDFEFGTELRTNTASGPGRAFYEPATFSIRYGNVDTISFMGWERPILTHEHDLRSFSRAFRALPKTDPVDFAGTVNPSIPQIWVKWFDDRLAVLNDSANSETVTITFPTPVTSGVEVTDIATGMLYMTADQGSRSQIQVDTDPWSLRALKLEMIGPTRTPTPTSTGPTQTFTQTPSPQPTPTPSELLLNWGFEADGVGFVFPPMHWGGWGDDSPDGTVEEDQWGENSVFTPHGGPFGAGKTTNWGSTTSAGFYQEITVTPGQEYACTVYGHTPKKDPADGSNDPGELRLGVDPNGGTNRYSSDIIWTSWAEHPSGWELIGFTDQNPIVATGTRLTLFLEYRQLTYTAWNGMFFDDASVQIVYDVTPPSPTPTQADTPIPTATHTATPSGTLTLTPTHTPTATSTQTATHTFTAVPTPPPTSTNTTTATHTFSPTATGTATPTLTFSPTSTGTATPTFSPTPTGTGTATPTLTLVPTSTAGVTPTMTPCLGELVNPSFESGLTGWNSFYAAGKTEGEPKVDPDIDTPSPPNHEGNHRTGTSYGGDGDNAGGGIYQEVCVTPGWIYSVSFWGTITSEYPGDDRLELYWIDGGGADFSAGLPAGAQLLDSTASNSPLWTQLSGGFIPGSSPITIIMYWEFAGTGYAVNACHADDCHLTGSPAGVHGWEVY